jgi:NADPH:quinone reductase
MQALYIEHHGAFQSLRVTDIPVPVPRALEVRVEILAAAVNPSDIVSAAGRFPQAKLPRVLGRDFAGIVREGPSDLVGAEVYGSGGDLGITRDGTHAEQLVIPRSAVTRMPENLSSVEAAAVGVPFMTAWSALVTFGKLSEGQTVIISGATGSVGRAALEIAAASGARAIALVGNLADAKRMDASKVVAVAHLDLNDLADTVKAVTQGRGADLALNGVGAPVYEPLWNALAKGGRMAVYSAAAGREVTLNLFELYRGRRVIGGVDTVALDATRCAGILAQLTPLFESKKLNALPVYKRLPLSRAVEAYRDVFDRAPGKVVLMPDRSFEPG